MTFSNHVLDLTAPLWALLRTKSDNVHWTLPEYPTPQNQKHQTTIAELRRLVEVTVDQAKYTASYWQDCGLKAAYYTTEPQAVGHQTVRLVQKIGSEFATLAHKIANHRLIADGRGVNIVLRGFDLVNNGYGIWSSELDGNIFRETCSAMGLGTSATLVVIKPGTEPPRGENFRERMRYSFLHPKKCSQHFYLVTGYIPAALGLTGELVNGLSGRPWQLVQFVPHLIGAAAGVYDNFYKQHKQVQAAGRYIDADAKESPLPPKLVAAQRHLLQHMINPYLGTLLTLEKTASAVRSLATATKTGGKHTAYWIGEAAALAKWVDQYCLENKFRNAAQATVRFYHHQAPKEAFRSAARYSTELFDKYFNRWVARGLGSIIMGSQIEEAWNLMQTDHHNGAVMLGYRTLDVALFLANTLYQESERNKILGLPPLRTQIKAWASKQVSNDPDAVWRRVGDAAKLEVTRDVLSELARRADPRALVTYPALALERS